MGDNFDYNFDFEFEYDNIDLKNLNESKPTVTRKNYEEKQVTNDELITLKINKKFFIVLIILLLIIVFMLVFVHHCQNCGNIYFGFKNSAFGGSSLCRNCYHYFVGQ